MSWNQWNTGIATNVAPNAQAIGSSSIQNSNAASHLSFNPTIMPPGNNYPSQFSGMTPEQQYAMQQNWQQWQSYQQQYAQWHAQYGEQYKREMEVKLGTAPPSLPFVSSITNAVNIPQYPQVIQNTSGLMYSIPPPPPESDLRKPNNVPSAQPPPPPPPPDNSSIENITNVSKLLSNKIEIEIDNAQNNKRTSLMGNQLNYTDQTTFRNSNIAQNSNKVVDCSPTENNTYSSITENKSREEKIFDEQFKKWEEEFENWKKANVNHPDKKAYQEYEMKFEECRRKLTERREQMKRKKIQQEQQARHDQQIREDQIRQDQHRREEEIFKQKQNMTVESNVTEKTIEPQQQLVTKTNTDDTENISDTDNNDLFDEKPESTRSSDIIEIKVDFLESGKKSFEIPGLDLVQTDEPKEQEPNSNIIDLDKIDGCDVSDNDNWIQNSKRNRNEKSRWGNNERKEDWNSENSTGTGLNSNKIPSLLDQKFEKPNFSPPHEKSDTSGFSDNENKAETSKQNPPTFESGSNDMQHLAKALSDPNVMALLSAALQKNDSNTTADKRQQERNFDTFEKITDTYKPEVDNIFFNNDFGNKFGGGNENQGNQFTRKSFGSRVEGSNDNRLGRNAGGLNIPIWEKDYEHNNWRNQNSSGIKIDNSPFQSNWNQQNFRQDSQSHRNPYNNALNRGSRDDFKEAGNREIFDNNNKGHEWVSNKHNIRNKMKTRKNNQNFNNSNASMNKDNKFNENIISDSNDNNGVSNRSSNFKQNDEEDNYFRPAQIIDYQNKSLSNIINKNATLKEAEIVPKKIVEYGHKTPATKNTSSKIDTEEFFPMKTFDYGHASNKKDLQPVKLKQSFGDFLANRTNIQKRKADDDGGEEFENKKNLKFIEQNNLELANKRVYTKNSELQRERLQIPCTSGNENIYQKNRQNINDSKMEENYLSDYSSKENLDKVINVEQKINFDHNDTDKDNLDPLKSFAHLTQQNISYKIPNIIDTIKPEVTNHLKNIVKKSENINSNQISIPTFQNNNTIPIEEIILNPGRIYRPKNITIILRGPPGSGKSYIAKLIKDKEIELHGSAPRLLSIDDYFMVEIDKEEKCNNTGRKTMRKELVYEYDDVMESKYYEYLIKSFKKTLMDKQFNFIIVDCVNQSLRTFTEFYNLAKLYNYTPYTIDLYCDFEKCIKQNVHNRRKDDLKNILKNWNNTPNHYIKLGITNMFTSFKQSDKSNEEKDNSVCAVESDNSDSRDSNDSHVKTDFLKCKWDVDASEANLARLDGTRKNCQTKKTIEDYLQMDGWEPPQSKSNKKRVRWADIEEKREQDKMRAIGFVVGQTDWNRMLDPTGGSSALTKTKFIEKLSRK